MNLAWPGPGKIIRPLPRLQPETPASQHGWLRIQLVRTPRIRQRTYYALSAPIVVTPPSQPPVVTSTLGALAQQPPRRTVRSKIAPPAVVNQPAQPPVDTIALRSLAGQPQRRRTISRLGGPAVVQPAAQAPQPPVETTVRVNLAQVPRQARISGYGLGAPTIVSLPPLSQTVRVNLAKSPPRQRQRTRSTLRVPAAVGSSAPSGPPTREQQTLRTNLVAVPRAALVRAHWQLRAPTVLRICPVITPVLPGTLTLIGVAPGSLTLTAATPGALSLTPAGSGALALTPAAAGTLILDPVSDDC